MDEQQALREKVWAHVEKWDGRVETWGAVVRACRIEVRADEVYRAFHGRTDWAWCYNFARLDVDAPPHHEKSEYAEMSSRREEGEYAHTTQRHT